MKIIHQIGTLASESSLAFGHVRFRYTQVPVSRIQSSLLNTVIFTSHVIVITELLKRQLDKAKKGRSVNSPAPYTNSIADRRLYKT